MDSRQGICRSPPRYPQRSGPYSGRGSIRLDPEQARREEERTWGDMHRRRQEEWIREDERLVEED